MNVETARSILDIDNDNAIIMVGWHYAYWAPGESRIVLDGAYTVQELEAIVWWMKNKSTPYDRMA